MPEPVNAAGYIRVSMKREEMLSPALQQASQDGWAKANGRRITDWVIDLDATGRNFKRKVMGLIQRVERGEIAEIIVYRYDRWGRNTAEALANVERVEIAGGALISATEPIDAETAIGKYNRTNAFAMAQMQSDIIGENWKSVMAHRLEQGLPRTGRAARFGYRRLGRIRNEADSRPRTRREGGEEERYVPDPALGQVLAGMYRAYTAGDGSTVIARRLNDAGIMNTEGRLWSGRTVLAVLDSGFGAGLLRIHDPACRCKTGCRKKIRVPGRHEPVITGDEWAAYLERRKKAPDTSRRNAVPVYPVTGLVKCGHCSGALVATGDAKGRPVSFRCISHKKYRSCPGGGVAVPLAVLLAECKAFLAGLAADIDARAATTKARAMVVKDARAGADRLAAELAAVDRNLARLARLAVESDDLPATAWQDQAREYRAQRDRLEKQLNAVKAEASAADSDPLPEIAGIMSAWDILPAPALNQILRAVIREVTVSKLGPAVRDGKGHFRPQQVSVTVVPKWASTAE